MIPSVLKLSGQVEGGVSYIIQERFSLRSAPVLSSRRITKLNSLRYNFELGSFFFGYVCQPEYQGCFCILYGVHGCI